jgi:hypothetical protein
LAAAMAMPSPFPTHAFVWLVMLAYDKTSLNALL